MFVRHKVKEFSSWIKAYEAFEADRQTMGVTGHGVKAPVMHKQSLEHFDFDSVMLAHTITRMT